MNTRTQNFKTIALSILLLFASAHKVAATELFQLSASDIANCNSQEFLNRVNGWGSGLSGNEDLLLKCMENPFANQSNVQHTVNSLESVDGDLSDEALQNRLNKLVANKQNGSENGSEDLLMVETDNQQNDEIEENVDQGALSEQMHQNQQNWLNQLKIANNQNKAAQINQEINDVAAKQAAQNAVDQSNQAVEKAQHQLELKKNKAALDEQYQKVLKELESQHTALKNKNNFLAQKVKAQEDIVRLQDKNNALKENNKQLIERSNNLESEVSKIKNGKNIYQKKQKASQQRRDNVQLYFALSVIIVGLVYFINSLYKMLFNSKRYVVGV